MEPSVKVKDKSVGFSHLSTFHLGKFSVEEKFIVGNSSRGELSKMGFSKGRGGIFREGIHLGENLLGRNSPRGLNLQKGPFSKWRGLLRGGGLAREGELSANRSFLAFIEL